MEDGEHCVYTEYFQDISKLINKNVYCMLRFSKSKSHNIKKRLGGSCIKVMARHRRLKTELKTEFIATMGEDNDYSCFPLVNGENLPLNPNSGEILSVTWDLAGALWLPHDLKYQSVLLMSPFHLLPPTAAHDS